MLVAIAIPVFTAQLEKSREATDMANIRSAYAEVVVAGIDAGSASKVASVSKQQTQDSWQTTGASQKDVAGVRLTSINATDTTTITYHPADGSTEAYVSIDGNKASGIEIN